MPKRPTRKRAKTTIQTHVSKEAFQLVSPLLAAQGGTFKSFSSLFETIVFLSEHMYIVEPDNGFISQLVELRARRVVELLNSPQKGEQRSIHVTLDKSARDFIDMLKARYRSCFSSRAEICDLLLLNIGQNCTTAEGVAYYCNRLNEVLKLHP